MTRRTQDSNLQWLSPSPVFKTGSLPIRIIRHLNGAEQRTRTSTHLRLLLRQMRLPIPPIPQIDGAGSRTLTGTSVRSTDFLTTPCHHGRLCVVVWTMSSPYLATQEAGIQSLHIQAICHLARRSLSHSPFQPASTLRVSSQALSFNVC